MDEEYRGSEWEAAERQLAAYREDVEIALREYERAMNDIGGCGNHDTETPRKRLQGVLKGA